MKRREFATASAALLSLSRVRAEDPVIKQFCGLKFWEDLDARVELLPADERASVRDCLRLTKCAIQLSRAHEVAEHRSWTLVFISGHGRFSGHLISQEMGKDALVCGFGGQSHIGHREQISHYVRQYTINKSGVIEANAKAMISAAGVGSEPEEVLNEVWSRFRKGGKIVLVLSANAGKLFLRCMPDETELGTNVFAEKLHNFGFSVDKTLLEELYK